LSASSSIISEIPQSEPGGSTTGGNPQDERSPKMSTSSGEPSRGSKPPSLKWKQPKTVKEFASQASVVCTRLLNGEMDLEVARAYSGIARIVAQAVSSEVTKSRFLSQKPDLEIDEQVFEEE